LPAPQTPHPAFGHLLPQGEKGTIGYISVRLRFMTFDLVLNALASGLQLGAFYALAAAGLSVAFGLIDIVNIAHPAMMVASAFIIAEMSDDYGLDAAFSTPLVALIFAALGWVFYRFYHQAFERKGDEAIRGIAFFFGLMFLIETALLMRFGADQKYVEPTYADGVFSIGAVDLPYRMLIPAALSLAVFAALSLFLRLTFLGRAVSAVAQDPEALRLLGVNPVRVKSAAFAIAAGLAALAGGALIILQPVDSSSGRIFIGRVFAIVIMGGLGSLPGTLLAGLLFGVIEDMTATIFGPSWSPAIAFGLLLGFLALRPRGLFGAAA
jgi:branched-chain amino acid transport system permease protein